METDTGDVLAELRNVHLRLSDRTLIHSLSLSIRSGRRIGITGPSGCGKSTLLRGIAARRLPDNSSAEVFRITKGRIGYVPQQGGTLPWYSLRRNLQVFATSGEREVDAACNEALKCAELTQVATAFPHRLSGGEIQRARLACAHVVGPVLYCADEPLTEVGLQQKWRLLERWSADMGRQRSGLLLVSHDVDTIIYLCDEVIILGALPGHRVGEIDRFVLPDAPHPRTPEHLTRPEFEKIRRRMIGSLYMTAPEG